MRTQEEVLHRYREADAHVHDMFGFRREVLIASMTAETLKQIGPVIGEDLLAGAPVTPPEKLEDDARAYLVFAIGKIVDHRGISASRSVEKLTEYAWLLGRDDVVEAMGQAEYAQYGAPQVQEFAKGMGWPFLDATDTAEDRESLERMARGEPCTPGCEMGCGQ